jgi:hypothetical protein
VSRRIAGLSVSILLKRSTHRRLAVEAGLFVLLLALWGAGRAALLSPSGLLGFVERPPVAELVEQDLWVADGRQRSERITLGGVRTEPGTRYLLRIRATAGPAFQILGLAAGGDPVLRRTIPARVEAEETAVLFAARAEPETLRIQIAHRRAGELHVTGATLFRVRPGFAAARVAFLLLAPLLVTVFAWRNRGRVLVAFREPDGLSDGVLSTLIFALCFWAFLSADVEQIIDSKFTTAVSQSLLERGTLELSPDFVPTHAAKAYPLVQIRGRWFHFSAAATAILDAPFVAAFELFGVRSVAPDGTFVRSAEGRILAAIAAFLAALLCSALYHLGRLFLAPLPALVTTGLCAFGTQVFSSLSRPYWTHSWAVLLLTLALYLVLSPRLSRHPGAYLAAATFLSWAVACRPIYAVSAAMVTALVLLRSRRFVLWLVAGGGLWLGLLLFGSFRAFGSLPPYLTLHAGLFESAGPGLRSLANGALGTLVSPARGLLLFVPLAAWVLWEAGRQWHRLPSRSLAAIALGACGLHWVAISAFPLWWGGQSFGPRLLVDALPWFFLLGVLAVSARDGRWSPTAAAVLVLVATLSIFVNTRGAVAKETWSWRSWERPPRSTSGFFEPAWAWNWRYPQFTAGLLAPDSPEAEAAPDGGD